MAQCPKCTPPGSGKCWNCGGMGKIADQNSIRPAIRTCPACRGNGKCVQCKGTGQTVEHE